MKNFLYIIVVLFIYTLSVNAQVEFSGDFLTVPSYFTYSNKPYILNVDYDESNDLINSIEVYDMSLNKIETEKIDDEIRPIDFRCIVDKNGIGTTDFLDDVFITQTLFNDDADWEYLVPVYDNYDTFDKVSYNIKKTNGVVIGSIPVSLEPRIFVINDVVYVAIYKYPNEGTSELFLFSLPEYRKFISNFLSGVKNVSERCRIVSKEAYDIVGRRTLDNHKGISINKEKKMMVK